MTEERASRRATALEVAAVLLVALVVHANTLRVGFIQDDYQQILGNRWLSEAGHLGEIFTTHSWGFLPWYEISNYYRPLMHLANLAVYRAFGPEAAWFHAFSLLLHAANSVLLYFVARGFARRALPPGRWRSTAPALAAVLFAANPACSEAVAWLGSVQDLLYAFFGMTMIALHARHPPTRPAVLPALAFLAALLGKETAVVLPALLLAYDVATGRLTRGTRPGPLLAGYAPYLAAGAAYLGARLAALGSLLPAGDLVIGTQGSVSHVTGPLQALRWYVIQLAFPVRHNFFPSPTPVEGLLGAGGPALLLFAAALAAGVVVLLRGRRFLLWPLALVLLPLLPPALLSGAIANRMAERYLYLPAMGFSLLAGLGLAWALARPGASRLAGRVVAAAAVALLGTFAAQRNADFRDEVGLWREAIAAAPHLPYAHSFLATALFRSGRLEEGIAAARVALTLDATMVSAWYDLGEALLRQGRYAESAEAFESLLRLTPGDAEAVAKLGQVYQAAGDAALAAALLEKAHAGGLGGAEVCRSLGRAYEGLGRIPEALRELEEAWAREPGRPDLFADLARVRAKAAGRGD